MTWTAHAREGEPNYTDKDGNVVTDGPRTRG